MKKLVMSLLSTVAISLAGTSHGAVSVTTIAEVDAGSGGIEVTRDGTVYTSDFGPMLGNSPVTGTKIWKVSPNGETEIFAEGFEGASGSAMDAKGNFFQANIRGNYISKIAPDGTITKYASEGLYNPVGLVAAKDGTLWVANCGAGSIQKVGSDGSSELFVKSDLLKCPNGLTQDGEGNLYAANFYNGDVVKVTPKGEASVLASLPGKNNGHLVFSEGSLYVVDRGGHQIFKLSLDGELVLFAGSGEKGGEDGSANEASFCYPNDIDVSDDGKTLYVNDVADEKSNGMKLGPTRIRKISLN